MNITEQTEFLRDKNSKSTTRFLKRLCSMAKDLASETDQDIIDNTEVRMEHMIHSLTRTRDEKIRHYKNQLTIARAETELSTRAMTHKMVSGAVRDTINKHGPITKAFISSASKRIYGNLCTVQKLLDDHDSPTTQVTTTEV